MVKLGSDQSLCWFEWQPLFHCVHSESVKIEVLRLSDCITANCQEFAYYVVSLHAEQQPN